MSNTCDEVTKILKKNYHLVVITAHLPILFDIIFNDMSLMKYFVKKAIRVERALAEVDLCLY